MIQNLFHSVIPAKAGIHLIISSCAIRGVGRQGWTDANYWVLWDSKLVKIAPVSTLRSQRRTMNKLLTALLAVSILFLAVHGKALAANGDTAAGKAVSKAPYASTQKQQTLLFFINPYGRPCQTQDAILKGMAKQLAAYNAKVKYIKTTEMESAQPYFRKYGVRALPMIIVLDENGAVKKRFPPGIQNQFALAAALE